MTANKQREGQDRTPSISFCVALSRPSDLISSYEALPPVCASNLPKGPSAEGQALNVWDIEDAVITGSAVSQGPHIDGVKLEASIVRLPHTQQHLHPAVQGFP